MRIIETDKVAPNYLRTQVEKDWVYNGLDSCVTAEILDLLLPDLDEYTSATYEFSKALQGPILEMGMRGVLIDQQRKVKVIDKYFESLDQLERQLDRIVLDGVGMLKFNWRSPADLRELFYGRLGIPPIKRQGKITVNRDALEKLETYFSAKQIVAHLILLREIGKKIGVLKTDIDRDNRMRTSYNIGGTDTGRLSSSFSEYGTGTNLQNIEEILRSVFIADPGMKMAYVDAQQGESRVVGAIEWNLFKDGRYLDACESGDLHTTVAKIVWPKLPWTGDLAKDRKLAEQPFYRHYDRRFMCKKIGHGSNYDGKPATLSQEAKVDIQLIKDFQPKYFLAFPAHYRWHENVDHRLRNDGFIISLTGRKRWFFGRRNEHATRRKAIAYDPQGSLADILNTGLIQLWKSKICTLLMQIHDAVLIQYPEEREDEIIPQVLKTIEYPMKLKHGRDFTIPYDCKTGWNWGPYSAENPDGLKTYKPGDKRKRTPTLSILDRKFY